MQLPNRKGGKKNRKWNRNYRIPGDSKRTGAVTRYRARHNIPAGSRKEVHAQKRCPKHN